MHIFLEAKSNVFKEWISANSSGMTWVVELRDHSDAQRLAIPHNFTHHSSRVNLILLKGSILCDVWIAVKVPREAIIVNCMPMKNIEFSSEHTVKDLFECVHAIESS